MRPACVVMTDAVFARGRRAAFSDVNFRVVVRVESRRMKRVVVERERLNAQFEGYVLGPVCATVCAPLPVRPCE